MGKHITYDYSVDTSVPPKRMIAAATDFSEKRPDLWPTVSRKAYKVYSQGDHTAEIEEVTPPGHHLTRYTWDDKKVTSTTVDASALKPGAIWEMRVSPGKDGGSHIEIHQDVEFKSNAAGFMAQTVTGLAGGAKFFEKQLMKTIKILEAEK